MNIFILTKNIGSIRAEILHVLFTDIQLKSGHKCLIKIGECING